jgi:exopolyphosphatase/pppGpp-phosphohydrolase
MDTSSPPCAENQVRLGYAALRRGVADGSPITVLHIGAQQTAVAAGSGSEPQALLLLAIGTARTAADYFGHQPPSPLEMENAIMAVEDEVTRARALAAGSPALLTADEEIREIALIAGVPDGPTLVLRRDAVEQTFGRLADITLGRPAVRDGLPTDAPFAATLLILREFMQHLQFESILVMKPASSP